MSCRIKLFNASELFESYVCTHQLNEDGHVSMVFNGCAKEIYNFPYNGTGKNFIYTGWNYISKRNSCEKLNNDKLYHPIMIKEINDPENKNIFSIMDREETGTQEDEQIRIIKNLAQSPTLYGIFHEFKHAIEMYIIDKNTIKNDKLTDIFNKEEILNLFDRYEQYLINIAINYKYLLLKSEQHAFIDPTIFYLKDNFKIDKYATLLDNIKRAGVESKAYNKLDSYASMLNELEINYKYKNYFLLIVLYMLYYENNNCKISINDLIKHKNNLSIYDNEASKILNIVKNSMAKYSKILYNAIYMHIFDKMK